MKLTGFQITKYRNIIDSGWIDVDDIAALVGQNECGKSNLLIALSKLNSFDGHKYKMAEDWPIDLWAERDDSTVVCTAKFEFASADIADLHAAAQPPPPASKEGEPDPPPEVPWPGDLHMTVTRSYKNKHSFAFSSELPAGHKTQKAEEWAAKTLPKCVYMDDRVKKQAKEQTQRAYDTNASSRHLSSQFKDRWNQKRVKFDIRVDGPHLNIFVEDTGLEAFVPMEARSRGFQWYVSFVWRFTHASKGQYENCILLLDEPGVHLHHAGHADLLTFMEILAETNTVVYTTHLATMLDLAYPERLRIMEVHDHHASVIKSMVSSQDKPMMVIEAALNLAGGMSGLLGNRQNLIVEGGQDAVILHKLSGVLRNSGEEGLSDRVYLLPARGAPNTPMYAGFMVGNGWDAGVLLDADSAGEEARKKIKELYLDSLSAEQQSKFRVLMIGDAASIKQNEAAIEDLFPAEFYLACVNDAYGTNIAEGELPDDGSDQICKRVEAVLKQRGRVSNSIDKALVMGAMQKRFNKMRKKDDLPTGTAAKARKLIDKINAVFAANGEERS